MKDYKGLALRYLKMNKSRNRIAILGVIITAILVTAFLNVVFCFLLQFREETRADGDYEAILFTQSEAQAQAILEDDRIESAYIGPYYDHDIHGVEQDIQYQNCLYINVRNPYTLERQFTDLCGEYGVEGEINDWVASGYFQGMDKNDVLVFIYFSLVIAYIIAIFGVGIVRNAIQLDALENIRDYGNLRCIGATSKQLKGLMYLQGAILELSGIGIGLLLGIGASLGLAAVLQLPLGFQPLIVPVLLIFFLGDLYFTMGENSKLITKMSPVSAIRGEYRIKKEKAKARKSGIFGKIFGMEGDYAYKSLMRNPGRFRRTTAAMAIGIAMIMTVTGIGFSERKYTQDTRNRYGYYQLYFLNSLNVIETIDEVHASLPATGQLAAMNDFREVTDSKREYSADIWLQDYETGHYTNEYLEYLGNMDFTQNILNKLQEREEQENTLAAGEEKEKNEGQIGWYAKLLAADTCYGYDDADLSRCKSALTAGTVDLSDHGIILVNPESRRVIETDDGYTTKTITMLDYQLGDTIDIVNMKRFREMMQLEIQKLNAERDRELSKLGTTGGEDEEHPGWLLDVVQEYELGVELTPTEEIQNRYYQKKQYAAYRCWKQLLAEGDYETYTIEGIISRDPNMNRGVVDEDSMGESGWILPLQQYYMTTGTDESMMTGMAYHIKNGTLSEKLQNTYYEITNGMWEGSYYGDAICTVSGYPEIYTILDGTKWQIAIAVLILTFVVLMYSLNFINATASNLHLRRKEFAQLQVLGATRGEILKMTLLEGVITTLVSNLIGITIGCGLSAWLYYYIMQLVQIPYYFPWAMIPICIAGSFLLLVGSIYAPMRHMTRDMIGDLTTGGD